MYEEFYHLTERPFTLSPDPAFLFLGKSHRRAMHILEYGVASDAGITVISGEVGTGKTTLVRNLLAEIGDDYTVGMITNTQHDFSDLLKWVLYAYGIETDESDRVKLYKQLVEFISREHRSGHRVILIIDEAQNLGAEALEDIRMLTNINVDKDVVLQLILVGQPELVEMLRKKELRQFAQRVSADYLLQSLTSEKRKDTSSIASSWPGAMKTCLRKRRSQQSIITAVESPGLSIQSVIWPWCMVMRMKPPEFEKR
jgi:general secretion pathway protein A